MSFAIVIEGMTLVAFLVILAGGVQKRASGWKILSGMLLLVGVVELTSMSLMVSLRAFTQATLRGCVASRAEAKIEMQSYLYDNNDRFYPGWKLDDSWILCTVSGSVLVITAGAIIASAFTLPSEGGYELIPAREEE